MDGFRHKVSVVKQLVKRPGVRRSEIQKIFSCIENALDILPILCVDGETGQAGFPDNTDNLLISGMFVQTDDIGFSRHGGQDRGIPEIENVLNPLRLVLVDSAFFLSQLNHHAKLFFCKVFLLRFCLHSQQTQHQVRGKSQKGDYRFCQKGDGSYDPAGKSGDLIGFLHGCPFRNQLPENQGKVGEDQGNENDGHSIQGRRRENLNPQNVINPVRQGIRKILGCKGAAQKTGQGNSNLYGREKAGWLFCHG